MQTEFKLPELGENIESGDVVNILVSEGETIDIDDPVLELETDKATVEVPSSVSGVVKKIHVQVGDTIKVGQLILTAGNGAAEPPVSPTKEESPVSKTETAAPPPESETKTESASVPVPSEARKDVSATPQIVEFKLPELGENIESGTVVRVLVAAGDTVKPEQGVLEIETDKATIEVPISVGGTIKEAHITEGDKVVVGQLILTLETTVSAATPTPAKVEQAQTSQPEPAGAGVKEPQSEAKPEPSAVTPGSPPVLDTTHPIFSDSSPRLEHGLIPAAPNVRRLAREVGVNLSQVTGTGPAGRISMDDVKRFAREVRTLPVAMTGHPPPLPDFSRWGEVERQKMSGIRRAIAEHMDRAWTTIPHVTQFDKADITDLEELRKRFGNKAREAGGKLTITAILLKVVAGALKEFPQFNASIDVANEEIIYKQYYHIGVAVDTERGLLVPVIRNVNQKNILELAVELGEVAQKARDGKLSLEDMRGGTFTITNLGGIGGTHFTPLINTPEVAILGVSRGQKEPVFNTGGQFEPRLMLPLSLSYDHRLIDGADGARFLRWVVEYLEQPFLTALQGW